MPPNSRRWTREESLIVFNLYCWIPFKDSDKSHPEVRRIAQLVGRTPDAVSMKIGNFGSLDPELQKRGIKGLRNASHLDREVWVEFHQDWQARITESERLIAEREQAITLSGADAAIYPAEGRERIAARAVRENQDFFRRAILSAYENRCCVTGIDMAALLNASHIKPWAAADKTEKLNPQNGLCLNALHDRAFDRGLITLSDDYVILVSSQVRHTDNDGVRNLLLDYAGRKIRLPSRFAPRADFLAWHRDNVFAG